MATIENGRRLRVFSARLDEEFHASLLGYARRHRRSLASAGTLLLEQALERALREEGELADHHH